MIKVTRHGKEFDVLCEVVNKRPDEAAQRILDLEDKLSNSIENLDWVLGKVESIIESGDYSRATEAILLDILVNRNYSTYKVENNEANRITNLPCD